jgi:hypothetical protein
VEHTEKVVKNEEEEEERKEKRGKIKCERWR